MPEEVTSDCGLPPPAPRPTGAPWVSVDSWLGRAKIIIEIAAILVAGFWIYALFIAGDVHLLAARQSSHATVEWTKSGETGRCIGHFTVTIHNIGKVPIDLQYAVASAHVLRPREGAEESGPLLASSAPAEADSQEIRSAKQLVGVYRSEQRQQQRFSFDFSGMNGRIVQFRFQSQWMSRDLWKDEISQPIELVDWSIVCPDKEQST